MAADGTVPPDVYDDEGCIAWCPPPNPVPPCTEAQLQLPTVTEIGEGGSDLVGYEVRLSGTMAPLSGGIALNQAATKCRSGGVNFGLRVGQNTIAWPALGCHQGGDNICCGLEGISAVRDASGLRYTGRKVIVEARVQQLKWKGEAPRLVDVRMCATDTKAWPVKLK